MSAQEKKFENLLSEFGLLNSIVIEIQGCDIKEKFYA